MAYKTWFKIILDSVTIGAGEVAYSDPFNIEGTNGEMGLYIVVVGNGQITIQTEIKMHPDVDFVRPTDEGDIVTDFTATDGNDTDGRDVRYVALIPCLGVRFKITETGGVNSVTATFIAVTL